MKNTLRFTTLILTLTVLVSSLFACGGKGGDAKPTEKPSTDSNGIEGELLYTEYDTSCIKTFAQYKGGKITKDLTVSEEEITDEYIASMSEIDSINAGDEGVTDEMIAVKSAYFDLLIRSGVVKNGDIISFDYEGFLDGEAFSGGKAVGAIAAMGSGHFIPTFEDQIIGHEVGETFDINVKFPDNYGNEDLAAKDTVFTISVNYIVPGLSDETANLLAKYYNTTFTTAEAYKNDYIENRRKALSDEFDEYFLSEVLSKIYKETEFNELPKADVEAVAKQLEAAAAQYGLDVETYMYYMYGITDKADIDTYCTYQVALQYIIAKIIQNENMVISDEEYKDACEKFLTQYNFETVEELEAAAGIANIKNMIYVEKLNTFITENWTVEVKE